MEEEGVEADSLVEVVDFHEEVGEDGILLTIVGGMIPIMEV